jgi:hypothetical protein
MFVDLVDLVLKIHGASSSCLVGMQTLIIIRFKLTSCSGHKENHTFYSISDQTTGTVSLY